MLLYGNTGLLLPSHVKNQSANFPAIKLQENAAQGMGFFTSRGESGDLDTNVSHADAEKYLRNLPLPKRSLGYVAVLLEVTAAEAEGPFVQSIDPAVYMYKGDIDAAGNITDEAWQDFETNWQIIQGGSSGSGNIAQQLEGLTKQTTSTINFVDVDHVTNITFTDTPANLDTDNAFQFDIASDFARADQNFYLGAKATAFIAETSIDAAEGVSIQSAGAMKFKKAGEAGTTIISGGSVSVNNLSASVDIQTSGGVVRAGSENSQHSAMSSSQLTTDTVNANVKIETPKIQADGNGDIKFYVPTAIDPAFVVATSDDLEITGASTTAAEGMSQIYTNAELRILHAPTDTQLEFLYGVGSNGKVVKIARTDVADGASAFTPGFGITITNPTTPNPGIQINQSDVVTTSGLQTIAATKEIGQVILTGNTGVSESNVDGLRFNEDAIDNIADQSETADNINLLYVINNQSSNRHGTVYRGVSGSTFLNTHVELTGGLRGNQNISTDKLTLGINDIFVKSNANDASVYDLRAKRLGAHSFTPSEIASELNAHGNTENTLAQQTAIEDGPTIIEWVREFGDYVNGNSSDIATRRNSGVMMKAGFTAATNPYTAQGILDSKFRFSAKAAAVAESTDPSEELTGTVTFTVDATDTTYAPQHSDYAIQIGTQSTSASVGDRLNEVSIPNLIVKHFNVPNDGSSYIGGGGTFGGNWTFNGDVTVSGVLTATNGDNSLGSTATGTLATTASLLQLGSPSATATSDFNEREIGIVGLFNYDGDGDGNVDNNEAMATSFFRDHSESGVAEIFGRSAAAIGAGGGTTNHHRPWKLMTSVEKINTFTTSIDTTDDFFPTALEVGGIRFSGYDPDNATYYSTKFFNRVVTDIENAASAEAGSVNEPWEGGGGAGALTGALASAKAIKAYVDNEISGLGGFSSAVLSAGTFDFGFSGSDEVATASNSYTSSDADRILLMDTDDSDNVKEALPSDLGLALYADSDETVGSLSRGDVGWLPGATPLGAGTSLRTILNKVFTAPDLPEIEYYDLVPTAGASSQNDIFLTAVNIAHSFLPSSSAFSIFEHGYNDFGDNAQTNTEADLSGTTGVAIKLKNYAGVESITHRVDIGPGLTITDSDGGTVNSSNVDITALVASTSPILGQKFIVGDDIFYFLDLSTGGTGSANKVLNNDGEVDLLSTTAQSTIKFKASLTLNDDFAGFTSPAGSREFTYFVRRRSFMFVSNLDVRNSLKGSAGSSIVDSGLDFNIPNAFAKIDGTKATAQTDTSFSQKFMHYLIATATSDTSSVLGSADIAEDPSNVDIVFNTSDGLLGANAQGGVESITSVKIRNVIVSGGAGLANTPNSSGSSIHVPHFPAGQTVQRYPGMLAELKGVVGSQQYWPRSTATTSSDGYLYRAAPIQFAGGGVASSWVSGDDSLFVVSSALGDSDELVRNSDNSLLTFTMTNQYGVDSQYVLFQSSQTLDGTSAQGKFGDIVEVE